MARGIILAKPGSTGGTTAGRIMVTDPAGGSPDGSGTTTTTTTGADGTTSTTTTTTTTAPLSVGSSVAFTDSTTANVGDVVNFNLDANGNGVGIAVFKAGQYLNGNVHGNVTVNAGDSVAVAAHVDGKIVVNGGYLTILNGSHIEGKIDSAGDGSYIFISGSHMEGRVAVAGKSYLGIQTSVVEGAVFSDGNIFAAVMDTTVKGKIEATTATNLIVKNCTVDGKVSSDGGGYTSVTGSTIKGKLEVINVTRCACSGNTVDGKTNTPGCSA